MKNVKDPLIAQEFLKAKSKDFVILSFYGNDNSIIDFNKHLEQIEYCGRAFNVKDVYICNIDDEECEFNKKEYGIRRIPYTMVFNRGDSITFHKTFSNEIFLGRMLPILRRDAMYEKFSSNEFKEDFINGKS